MFQWMHPSNRTLKKRVSNEVITEHIVQRRRWALWSKIKAMVWTRCECRFGKLGVASNMPWFLKGEDSSRGQGTTIAHGIEAYHMNKKHWISIALNMHRWRTHQRVYLYGHNVGRKERQSYFQQRSLYANIKVLAKGDFFMVNIAIVGATGVVVNKNDWTFRGATYNRPLYLFASARLAGKVLQFRGKRLCSRRINRRPSVILITPSSSAGGTSLKFAPIAERDGVIRYRQLKRMENGSRDWLNARMRNAPTLERKIIATKTALQPHLNLVVPLRPLHDTD